MSFRRTPFTLLLIGAIGAAFLVEVLAGGSQDPSVLVRLGANVPRLARPQPWRLVTSIFLHIGIVHLLLNAWGLYQLGALFEAWMGSLLLLVVFFVTGTAGSFASVLWGGAGLSAGASGAIFGLLGALIAFLVRSRDRLTPQAKSLLGQLIFWAVINVIFGFSMPGIDNAAHLGGCAAGLVLGFLLPEPWLAGRG